ncbi:MAG: TonB-dependent receptor [Cellvibrionaceae bacterium]|nr:TonB-dependent receptor [Cellvibrionaceae bacterium]
MNLYNKQKMLLASAIAASAAPHTNTMAQSDTSAQSSQSQNWAYEEVVVTARKREESLQDVPVSVTAFSGAGLENRGISNLQGINNFTPNLELSNGRPDGGGSAAQAYIRGVGQSDFLFPNDPGVGLYVDDVYLARSVGGMLALVDVERVEVLRGPQGTLYGKNTIGGAIKVVTKKPTGEAGGKLQMTLGRYDRRDVMGSVDFAMGDSAAGRIQVGSLQRDGYVIRNFDGVDLGNEDKKMLRADFAFEASDNIDVRISADIQKQRQNGAPGTLIKVVPSTAGAMPDPTGAIDPVTNIPGVIPGTGIIETLYNGAVIPNIIAPSLGLPADTQFDERWITGNSRSSNGTAKVADDNDIWGISATIDWDLGNEMSLKSISAYRNMEAQFGRDGDHSPLPVVSTFNNFEQWQFSQELQLSGISFDDRLNWLAGVYAFKESASDLNDVKLVSGTYDLIGLEFDLTPSSDIDIESLAAFAHASYDISEKLSMTAGLRYTYEKKELARSFILTQSQQPITIRETGVPLTEDGKFGPPLEESWTRLSPKIGIDYHLEDDVLLYALFASGFKSGGWSPRPQVGTENKAFDHEVLNSFETGIKSKWMDGRLVANMSMFYNIYEDMQITTVGADAVTGQLVLSVNNAGEAKMSGLELEVKALPTPQLEVQMGLGYLNARYNELDESSGIRKSNELPDAPELTFNTSIAYHFDIADAGELGLRLGAAYKGKTYKDAYNTQPLTVDSYWLVDASISFETNDGDWRVALVGNNLTDEEYISNGVNVEAFGYFEGYFGRPREYALTVTRNF